MIGMQCFKAASLQRNVKRDIQKTLLQKNDKKAYGFNRGMNCR
jgi:hypothetical protein